MPVWVSLWHMREMIYMAYENHGDEWGLIWYLQWGGTYISAACTYSKNLAGLKISTTGTFLKWFQRPSQSAQE